MLIGRLLISVLLVTSPWPRVWAAQGNGAAQYDAYVKGVRMAEVEVRDDAGSHTFSVRKRTPFSVEWAEAVVARSGDSLPAEALQLWGAISDIVPALPSLEGIPWTSLAAVGWPTAQTIYERHRRLEGPLAGESEMAFLFVEKDATRPMDLIFDSRDRLVAALDVNADIVLVRRGYEHFTTVARWNDKGVSPAKYGVRKLGMFKVRGEDGVGLSTLVYLPDGDVEGPYPTILVRTPYGISNRIESFWHYAARGYAVVFQAVRGQAYWDPDGQSEGTWDPMINEPRDGARVLEWITEQEWSDGGICMQGGSYVGFTQWTATMADNPALKCIIPESSMGTAFSDQPYMGGGLLEGLAYYVFWMLDLPVLPDRVWSDILRYRPLIDLDEYATGKDVPQWNMFVDNWSNGDFWRRQDWYRGELDRRFGAFQISGWFDDDFPGTERNWALVQEKSPSPQRLLVGPWKHGYNVDRALNGFSFGNDALRDDVWLLKQRWYDYHLKGMDNGVTAPVVEYFVLGSNEWRTASQWPPAEAVAQRWYLRSGGQASRSSTDGALDLAKPTEADPPDVYRYDPANPPPNWMSFDRMMRWEDVQTFPYDFKDIEDRSDVAVYTSQPLERDVTISGKITAVLYASADVRDTDWWVHVSDVYPDGQSVRLTVGMLRARFRNLDDPVNQIFGSNFEHEELLSGDPDDIVRYDVSVPSIANTFRKGHRIRVAVMNAMDKYLFPNSNTGEREGYVRSPVVGTMRIHHGADHPSHLVLPVMP